jgi:hypothetical protein
LTKDDVGFLVIFMNENLIKRLKYLNLSGKISKLFKVFNCRSKLIIVEFCMLKLRSYRFTRRRVGEDSRGDSLGDAVIILTQLI